MTPGWGDRGSRDEKEGAALVSKVTREMPEQEEPVMEMPLTACISSLPRIMKLTCLTLISLDCGLLEGKAHALFIHCKELAGAC